MCIAVQLAVLPPKRRLSGLFFTSFIDCNVRAYQNLNSPLRQAVKQAGKEAGGGFFANEVHFRANLEDLRISHKRLFCLPTFFANGHGLVQSSTTMLWYGAVLWLRLERAKYKLGIFTFYKILYANLYIILTEKNKRDPFFIYFCEQ